MEKVKRRFSIILSFMFMFTFMQVPLLALAGEKSDEKVYIKIRLNNEKNDYEGWNFWVWEFNKDGKKVDFIGEDSDGKFAVVETSKGAEKLGVIARKSVQGNDWAINYTGDILVDLNNGDKEVIITYNEPSKETISFNNENINLDNNINDEIVLEGIDNTRNNRNNRNKDNNRNIDNESYIEDDIQINENDSENEEIIFEIESNEVKEDTKSSNIYEIKDLNRDFNKGFK